MSSRTKTRVLATVLITPIFAALAAGQAYAAANNEADFYVKSAQRLIQNKDLRGAEIQLRNAVQRAPQDGTLRMQLAELYLAMGNTSSAEAELIAAKQRGVTDERLAMLLAEVMFRNGEVGELLRQVPSANRSPQTESVVRMYRGLAELTLGQMNNAQAMLADAERLDPKAVPPKIASSRQLLASRDVDGADRKVDEALALAPKNSQALDLKGIILAIKGKPEESLATFGEAIKQDPGNIQAMIDRANLYIERGDIDSATKDVRAATKLSPGSPGAAYLSALIDARQGRYEAADATLGKFRPIMDRMPDAYLLAGVVKYYLNQTEQADTYLSRYVAQRKDKYQAFEILGAIALRQRNTDRAIAMLNQAQALEPNNPDIAGLLGQAYIMRGDTSKAMALLDQAIKSQPDNVKLKTELAMSRLTTGENPTTALDELSDVFKTDAGKTLAGPALVLASLRSARTDEAAVAAEALVKQDANNLFYQQLLAVTRIAQQDLPAAEKIFRGILDKQPNTPAVRRTLAQVYLGMGRPADAKKLFQDKIAKDANDADSIQALAALYANEKDYANAVTLFTRAAQVTPSDPSPRLQLVAVYEIQKKWPDALKEARTLVTTFPGDATVRDTLGRIYRESGDLTNSVQAYRDAVKALPNSAIIQANYALAAAESKDYPTASAAMSKAITLAPRDDRLKVAHIAISYAQGGADAALNTAKAFSKDNPQDPTGDILSADVLDRSGKRAEGIALLDKSMAARPSVATLMKEVTLLDKDKNLPRAIALLEGWTKAHPADVEPRYQLAQYYGRVRNYRAAQTQFEKLAMDRPSDPVVLNNLAWFYARSNDPRARKLAEKAVQIAPAAPDIADTLGWIMAAQGDAEPAMKYLQIALKGLPENPDVQYHMALALSKTNKVQDARAMLEKALASKDDFDSKTDAKQLLDKLPAAAPKK